MSRRSITMARMRWVPTTHRRGGYTNIRMLWQDSGRRFSHIDPSPDGHARARNAFIQKRLRGLRDAHQRHLTVLWGMGGQVAFDAAYRRAAHTLCIVAGIHLAARRSARRNKGTA